jgi:hypothetical protein
MSLIIRYVDSSSGLVRIEESFLGFLDVNDTTGQALEGKMLEKIDYEHIIEDFISKNTKRMMLLNRYVLDISYCNVLHTTSYYTFNLIFFSLVGLMF